MCYEVYDASLFTAMPYYFGEPLPHHNNGREELVEILSCFLLSVQLRLSRMM